MALVNETQQQVYDLLSRSSNLSFVAAEPVEPAPVGAGQQVLTLAPGQRVTAEVIGPPLAGKVPVQIGTQQLNLDLQLAVRQGQNLELTFVGNDPRPTFALARPGVATPPVSLSDASRLLSLLVSNEQFMAPNQRSSLQSIGDLLRQSSGETSVLANFLDDFLTYRTDGRPVVVPTAGLLDSAGQQVGDQDGQPPGRSTGLFAGSTATFEDAASKMLLNLAQRSRLTLVDVVNHSRTPLPLQPGEEATALVKGHLPGGRVLVQLAGESLELQLSKPVVQGEILRLALVTQQPKLVFALLGQPVQDQPSNVSDAARWLSALVTREAGQSDEQQAVIARLQQVVNSLPPGSSALAAILDEAMTYGASASLSARSLQNRSTEPGAEKFGDGVLKLLQSLIQGNRLALIEPQLSPDVIKTFQPGQQMRGDVLQSLGGGRFMIQVGGQALDVLLPKGVKAGDGLNLFFVGEDPPTFLLVRYGKGGDALVSQTGRWVSTLLGMQNQSAPLQEGLGILRTLLQGVPSDPSQLEKMLGKGLQESGLFYEAHLARWFSGNYQLERLLQEPQSRLLQSLAPNEQQGNYRSGSAHPYEDSDPRAMAIIKEQLATLQTGQVLFQGELFPGQPMEWRVHEREGRGKRQDQEQQLPWETSVTLALPGLGSVQASLKLHGLRLDLHLEAGHASTSVLMEQEQEMLRDQFLAAGLEPGVIVVQHGK